ncbi:MAG: hypothetical protein ACK44A_02780 [Roseateles sp.]
MTPNARRLTDRLTRLAAAFILSTAAMAQSPEPTEAEVAAIAAEVVAHAHWLDHAARCPASVMPEQQAPDAGRDTCARGELKACLARCTAGDGGACYRLAQDIQHKTKSQAPGVLFQRSCQLGVVSGCTNKAAGLSLEKPDDEGNRVCAAQTYAKACAFDDAWACTMYALHLGHGIGIQKDKALASQVLEKSCKHGPEDDACSSGMKLKSRLQQPERKGALPK